MQKPLIAILSCEPELSSRLPERLRHALEILVCESVAEFDELLIGRLPQALIIDSRCATTDGNRVDRIIAGLQQSDSNITVFRIVGQEPCAESACAAEEGSSLTERVVTLDGVPTAADIADAVLRSMCEGRAQPADIDARAADSHGVMSPARANPTCHSAPAQSASLAGMTRHIETHTPALRRMLEELEIAARHDVTVLLIGETGCGKTYLSRLIHEISPRADQPFLHVACGALPAELIESELFGHVKGAFTSAYADKEGKFLAARRGTVLLDEIDVLSPEQQVKLLRVIETGEFEAVGANQTMRSEARLVVASNQDLQPLVERGRFRPDLYYRLNMLKFEIPPLRRRQPDIAPLARQFVARLAERHGITIERIDASLLDALQAYPWPGNVRELENVIQRAVIYCRHGILTADSLPQHILAGRAGPGNDPSVSFGTRGRADETRRTLETRIARTERDIIEQALSENNFSRTNTARELGISRVTLYNKMKKYGMSK